MQFCYALGMVYALDLAMKFILSLSKSIYHGYLNYFNGNRWNH